MLSSIYYDDGYVYAAGFTESMKTEIEKINYMSYIENDYKLDEERSNQIILKMIKLNGQLLAALSCDMQDSIIIMDLESGEKREYSIDNSGSQSIFDIFIYKNELFILYSNMKISIYDLYESEPVFESDISASKKKQECGKGYNYIYYLIFFKNVIKDFCSYFIKITLPLMIIFAFYTWYKSIKSGIGIDIGDISSNLVYCLLSTLA
jgi:hypothetical protein